MPRHRLLDIRVLIDEQSLMNHSSKNSTSGNPQESGILGRGGGRTGVGKKKAGSIAIVVLAALYTFLQPHLNQQFGWNLPGLKKGNETASATTGDVGSSGDATLGSASEQTGSDSVITNDDRQSGPRGQTAKPASQSKRKVPADTGTKTSGPLSDRMKPTGSELSREGNRGPPENESDAKYGLLREIGSDRYMSPEGLQYTPGSAEGHRLEHLRRHTADLPSRSGSHGVFDGGMEGALKTIDRAYARAKKNQRTTKKTDKNRTIYTVDMGGRVGFVGGRDGNRKRKPMARRVRLVLEGTRVITAYPMN